MSTSERALVIAVFAAALAACASLQPAPGKPPAFGASVSAEEVARWDISIPPSGAGLPGGGGSGRGTKAQSSASGSIEEETMRKISSGAILFAAFGALAHAQTQQELLRDGNSGSTDNVLTYGMGYHQQRYSPLRQINKSTVKRLVPVWSASLANEFGEQGQPLVYNGVLYAANVKRVVAIDVATGRQLWMTALEWDPT